MQVLVQALFAKKQQIVVDAICLSNMNHIWIIHFMNKILRISLRMSNCSVYLSIISEDKNLDAYTSQFIIY